MNQQKSATTNGINGTYFFLLVLGTSAIAVSLHLTSHYMGVHFPSGLGNNSVCDLSDFWNCDAATYSPFSNIGGIPISTFGTVFGVFLLLGGFFPSLELERTNHTLSWINFAGCVALFLYSLIALGTLCPFCTVYYLISALALFIFYKWGTPPGLPDLKSTAILASAAILIVGYSFYNIDREEKKIQKMTKALIMQFDNLESVDLTNLHSDHFLTDSDLNHENAPIRMDIFSDFQCPACKNLSSKTHELAKLYKGKLSMRYFFYPLDSNCNNNMQNQLHPFACQAAYLAHCSGKNFIQVHDDIFNKQNALSQSWIDKKARELGVFDCKNSKDTKDVVMKMIESGNKIKITSTPTLIINNKKISGGLGLKHFKALFDEIIRRANQ